MGMDVNRILCGDAFDILPDLPAESVHACVTDPPYGLAFMGRDWDSFEPREYQEWCEEWAAEVKRMLKPGGHLVAFSGNRTHHRLFVGVEDAGFEIRDTLTYHYGSGFPKAHDVSKAIDKAAGVEPDSVEPASDNGLWADDSEWNDVYNRENYDSPTTDAAREWGGFKTALKPATEFMVLARKPFDGTVAENVQTHGTGALNVGECRINPGELVPGGGNGTSSENVQFGSDDRPKVESHTKGRYPANVVFDEAAAADLDAEVGDKPSCDPHTLNDKGERAVYSDDEPNRRQVGFPDSGGPSRYFYTSKATRAERTMDGTIDNAHPTVKPQDLMEWLIKLVTAEGQRVIDPFAGTGTTCRAAKDLAREFVGIEKQPKWADVARARCGLATEDPSNIRSDESQTSVTDYLG